MEDLQVINRVKQGHTAEFKTLVLRYQQMVFTLCCRMLSMRADAEDMTQEIFIKAFQNLHKYEAKAPFGGWLYRIAYNETLNKIRSLKKHAQVYSLEDVVENDWQERETILTRMTREEQKATILDALDKLSRDDRFIVHAFYYEDMSIRELEEITGYSQSNIKIKLHRSRKVLAQVLDKKLLKYNVFQQ